MKKNILFLILLIFILSPSCDDKNESWNNPYDPNTPPDLWAPKNLVVEQIDSIIKLSWEQEIKNIDGFKIDRLFKDKQHNIYQWIIEFGEADKKASTWFDNSIKANPRYLYEYRIYGFAGKNKSTSLTQEIRPKEIKKTFTDTRDGEIYDYVILGDQTWMAENLNYETSSGSWYYKDSVAYGNKYGRLYNLITAESSCPIGWHLPSDNEWKILESYLGMSSSELDYSGVVKRSSGKVGLKLVPFLPGIENYEACGFDAQFGGIRYTDGSYNNINWHSFYWSSDQICRQLIGYNEWVNRMETSYNQGLSVRCIKNK